MVRRRGLITVQKLVPLFQLLQAGTRADFRLKEADFPLRVHNFTVNRDKVAVHRRNVQRQRVQQDRNHKHQRKPAQVSKSLHGETHAASPPVAHAGACVRVADRKVAERDLGLRVSSASEGRMALSAFSKVGCGPALPTMGT